MLVQTIDANMADKPNDWLVQRTLAAKNAIERLTSGDGVMKIPMSDITKHLVEGVGFYDSRRITHDSAKRKRGHDVQDDSSSASDVDADDDFDEGGEDSDEDEDEEVRDPDFDVKSFVEYLKGLRDSIVSHQTHSSLQHTKVNSTDTAI